MPVKSCTSDGKNGYRWGTAGKCYTYPAGNDRARREAKRKAIIQGIAAGERPTKALTGEQFTAVVEQAVAEAERAHLAKVAAIYESEILSVANEAAKRFAIVAAAEWQPPPEGWVLTGDSLTLIAARMNRALEPIYQQVVLSVGRAPLAHIQIDWTISHPLAQPLIDAAAQRTGARLGEAVQPVLRRIVTEAYELGLNVQDTAALIQTEIAAAAPWQAEMLARTDLNSLANGASKAAAKLAGMGFKTWDATLDEKTRPDHVDAHGQTVAMDSTFVVGGEEADYPGDPNLSDAQAANCRCTLVYGETLSEAEGLLASAQDGIMDPMATARKRKLRRSRRAARQREEAPMVALSDQLLDGMSEDAEAVVALVASARPVPFDGVAAIEGVLTDDNTQLPRVILARALTWNPPVPFLARLATAEGHDGAQLAGRIDRFRRMRGEGDAWDIAMQGELTTPYGITEVAPVIEDESQTGVSVDLGAAEWSIVFRDTFAPVPEEELNLESYNAGEYALGVKSAKIRAVTSVPVQALENARVAIAASALLASAASDDEALAMAALLAYADELAHAPLVIELHTAAPAEEALVASPAPRRPPRAWFETTEPGGKMPLTITEDGRVYGHLATWDSCHVGFLPSCVPPPRSPSNYAYAHVCELDCEDRSTVTVGKLMFSPTAGGHADRRLSASKAAAYYDRTGMAAAFLRFTDGAHGIWCAGALNPHLTDGQREEMRRELRLNPPSGDWRPINGQHELICGLAVEVPGFPTPRGGAEVTIVASGDGLELREAIIASSGFFDPDPAALAEMAHRGLVDEDMEAEREMRALAARAEGIESLAALADK